jgi:hypothetical protein
MRENLALDHRSLLGGDDGRCRDDLARSDGRERGRGATPETNHAEGKHRKDCSHGGMVPEARNGLLIPPLLQAVFRS